MKTHSAILYVESLTPDDAVKTRAALLWWLRHNGAQFGDILKGSGKWSILHSHNGARLCATGVRALDDLTLGGRLKAVQDTRAGWHIA